MKKKTPIEKKILPFLYVGILWRLLDSFNILTFKILFPRIYSMNSLSIPTQPIDRLWDQQVRWLSW